MRISAIGFLFHILTRVSPLANINFANGFRTGVKFRVEFPIESRVRVQGNFAQRILRLEIFRYCPDVCTSCLNYYVRACRMYRRRKQKAHRYRLYGYLNISVARDRACVRQAAEIHANEYFVAYLRSLK